jgi:deazaflavin-dependent oxidoreductase (nitroreductase family)
MLHRVRRFQSTEIASQAKEKGLMTRTRTTDEYNQPIIQEFRENGGKVGGIFEKFNMLLLHTIGVKSGKERVNPVLYFILDDRWYILASDGGTPTHPYWYYNVLAHPNVTFETGKETLEAQFVVLPREERDRIYQQLIVIYPPLIEYQINAGARVIPIIEVIRNR